MKNTKICYHGIVITEFPKDNWNSIEWKLNSKVVFTEYEYTRGIKSVCVGHGSFLDLLKKDVKFTEKEIITTVETTKFVKL